MGFGRVICDSFLDCPTLIEPRAQASTCSDFQMTVALGYVVEVWYAIDINVYSGEAVQFHHRNETLAESNFASGPSFCSSATASSRRGSYVNVNTGPNRGELWPLK